jgi:hypothetical protein
MLWPGNDEQVSMSRLLFVSLGLCISSVRGKSLTLSEIYFTLTSDDLPYSLAVLLDTSGRNISPLAYKLLLQWINCDRQLRDTTVFDMTTTLTDFAMSPNARGGVLDAMREGLHQSIARELLSQP